MKQSFLFILILFAFSAANAEIKKDTVTYKNGTTELKGYLVYNDAKPSKMPALLLIHEWWGRNEYAEMRADQFGSIGFVALAVDMYGDGKVTADTKEAGQLASGIKKNVPLMRERINAALEYLRTLPNVDTSKIGAIGYCFGGTVALELARSGADIKGAVCYHGSLTTPEPEKTKNVKAKIVVFHGASDPFVPESEIAAFKKEMDTAKADWQMHMYGGAVHSFSNPKSGDKPETGAAYNESADRRAAKTLLSFLVECFK